MQSERVRAYILHGIRATPLIFARLLEGVTDAELDRRPDPERFTLREVVCHLADWEPIWLERIRAIAERENPTLPGYDEGQFAIDNDYAHANIAEQMEKFATGRAALTEYVTALPADAWTRPGVHQEAGPMLLGDLVSLILGHDGYHARQMVEYREKSPAA